VSGNYLEVANLHGYYGESHVIRGVSFTVPENCVVSLLGRNGAGKTTTLRLLMNLLSPARGTVTFLGNDITRYATHAIVRSGMTLVPETRGMFASLTVIESLRIAENRRPGKWTIDRVLETFPRLAGRLMHRATQLSGGEQQMLAIGRALLLNPRLLLLDEPTEGLAPIVVNELLNSCRLLKQEGMAMLLVEQNVGFARRLADRAMVLGKGAIQWEGPTSALSDDASVAQNWLGV
jgi:branched-chain amino acid transport system ATP-binding protein